MEGPSFTLLTQWTLLCMKNMELKNAPVLQWRRKLANLHIFSSRDIIFMILKCVRRWEEVSSFIALEWNKSAPCPGTALRTSLHKVHAFCSEAVWKQQLCGDLAPKSIFLLTCGSFTAALLMFYICIFLFMHYKNQNFIIFSIILQGSNYHSLYWLK